MSKKRLFIGIKVEIAKELKNFIIDLKTNLKDEKFKWVDYSNYHLTLKFLGETSENLIPQIDNVLKNIAKNNQKFSIQLSGIGVFKNISNPRVLWIGINESEELNSLFNSIEDKLSLLGFKKEKRDFNPHLTIARIKFLKNKKFLLNKILNNCDKKWNQSPVNEFILFESILKREGAVYNELERYSL